MKRALHGEREEVGAVAVLPAARPAFPRVAATLLAVLAWCVAWYWPTATEIAAIWWRSETFAHGLVVLPIFAWLVWRKRAQIDVLTPEPTPWAAVLAVIAGFLWLLGRLASVAAAAHAGFVLMVIFCMASAIGWRLMRVLRFPLLFLLFAIPIGEFMLPMLMALTADATVVALRRSGVPVFQEGLYFIVPNGRWSVVEACSGIRYLISSLMVGSLYAYLTYSKLHKRLLFVLVALLVAIFANWVRAYLVVMTGYLSDNTIATGQDHVIYGSVFFAIVLMTMFWLGLRWSDPPVSVEVPSVWGGGGLRTQWLAALPAAVVVVVFPALIAAMDARVDVPDVAYELPAPAAGWSAGDPAQVSYRPHYVGARGEAIAAYLDAAGRPVLVYSALFAAQRDGAEMVTWGNGLVQPGDRQVKMRARHELDTALGKLPAALVAERSRQHAVTHWYVVKGRVVIRDWEVKVRLAVDRLFGASDASSVWVLATPIDERDDGAPRLRAFVAAHAEALLGAAVRAHGQVAQ